MSRTKRKNGEGSYGTKTFKGVVYKSYTAPNKEWAVYAKTAKELEQKKKKKEEEYRRTADLNDPNKKTVYQLCLEWAQKKYNKISPRTYDDYEAIIEKRIKEDFSFGNTQAGALTEQMIEDFLRRQADKYSKASVDKTWVVLKQVFEYGQDEGIMSRSLSFRKIVRPKEKDVAVKKKEIQCIDLKDMELLYKECYKTYSNGKLFYGNAAKLIVFIMYSGTRLGEATALKWKYVSDDMSSIRIRQSLSRIVDRDKSGKVLYDESGTIKHKTVEKTPKTESGERTVPLPERAVEILKFFSDLYPDHKPDDYVFLSSTGKPYQERNVEHTLERMLKNGECACKEYTPHSLRHGYGSVLISKGIDIKTVSKLLGHKDISTTYNIYIHVLEEDKIKAIKNVFDS